VRSTITSILEFIIAANVSDVGDSMVTDGISNPDGKAEDTKRKIAVNAVAFTIHYLRYLLYM